MNKKLIATMMAVLIPAVSYGASELTNNAELRFRMNHDQNQGFVEDATDTSWNQRLKWGMTYRAGEKLSANLSILHNSMWGQDNAEVASTAGNRNDDNAFEVNLANASWMVNNNVSVVLGRQAIEFGDGTIYHQNDWEMRPFSFDGVGVMYDTEFAGINFWGVKLVDANSGDGSGSDPERNNYVISVDVKNTPEFLNMLNIHIVKDAAQELSGTPAYSAHSTNARLDLTRFGLTLKGASNNIDYRATYSTVSGETELTGTKTDVSANMIDAEFGFSMAHLMNSRFSLGYHTDTGQAASATDVESYAAFANFYNMHANAGMMDIVRWGNLTDISVGWTGSKDESCSFGFAYHMFSRTEKDDTTNGGGVATSGEDDLGTEIDLWMTHKYDSGLMMTARLGMFSPGDAFGDDLDSQTQLFVEAKYNF